MENKEEIELIEKYLQGKMNSTERAEFEDLLAKDPSLAKEAAFLKTVENEAAIAGRAELKQKLNKISREIKKERRLLISKRIFSVAASIAVIFGVLFWYNNNNELPTENYAQKNPEPFEKTEIRALIRAFSKDAIIVPIQYSETNYGFAGSDGIQQNLSIVLVQAKEYHLHYFYTDTLFLFYDSPLSSIEIVLNNEDYAILLEQKKYDLDLTQKGKVLVLEEYSY